MLSVLLICATLGADPAIDTSKETYTVAHAEMTKTGKPMLVLISTDWCPACQVMKHRILPTLRERLAFQRTVFAMVCTVRHYVDGNVPCLSAVSPSRPSRV